MTLNLYDRRLQGWLASTALHVVLVVLFLVVSVRAGILPEQYSELVLFDVSSLRTSYAETETAGFPVATAPEQRDASAAVRLPERRPIMSSPNEVIPLASRREADVPVLEPARVMDELTRAGQERPPARQGIPTGDKITPATSGLREGLQLQDQPPSATGAGSDLPFQIQWVGSNRDVVRSVLPQYPPGIEREVELQFRFSVTPAGEVTAIRPLQKGDSTLEEAAITALRQWKFQTLPSVSPQSNQEAVITFKFKIRPRR